MNVQPPPLTYLSSLFLSLPSSLRCLKLGFDFDKAQPVLKGQECKKSYACFLGLVLQFPSEFPVSGTILFPHLIVKRCITPGSEMVLIVLE